MAVKKSTHANGRTTVSRPSREAAEAAVRVLLQWAGDDPDREGLRKTPKRVVNAFEEYFAGYGVDPAEMLGRTFSETDGYDEMVVLKDIRFESHCEHHLAPIIGKVHIAYLPARRVIGISKLARLVDVFAKRLQIQEKLTAQIANTLNDALKPKGVAVVVDASHQCMTTRGVHKTGVSMVTSRMLGAFPPIAGLGLDVGQEGGADVAFHLGVEIRHQLLGHVVINLLALIGRGAVEHALRAHGGDGGVAHREAGIVVDLERGGQLHVVALGRFGGEDSGDTAGARQIDFGHAGFGDAEDGMCRAAGGRQPVMRPILGGGLRRHRKIALDIEPVRRRLVGVAQIDRIDRELQLRPIGEADRAEIGRRRHRAARQQQRTDERNGKQETHGHRRAASEMSRESEQGETGIGSWPFQAEPSDAAASAGAASAASESSSKA